MTSIDHQQNQGRPVTVTFTATPMPVDEIKVVESPTIKYLHLRNGTFELRQSVFLVIDGEEREITTTEQTVQQFPS